MITLLTDSLRSLRGVWRLLFGRPDFPSFFDVTPAGVVRSFGAAIIGAPVYAFIIAAQVHAASAIGQPLPEDDPTFLRSGLTYVYIWMSFPLVAPVLARLSGRGPVFPAWLTVHNWSVLLLLLVQSSVWVLYLSGAANPQTAQAATLRVFVPLSLIVHWRIACQALGVAWGLGAMLACAHVLVNIAGQLYIFRMLPIPQG